MAVLGYKPHPLGRLFLSLHILPEPFDWRTASGSGEVAGGPPEVCATGCQLRELLAQHPSADAFEVVQQRRDQDRRRVLDQQVPMVRFAVQLHQLEAHLFGDAQKDSVHPVQSSAAQGLSPVLDHKDQMDNEPRNAVPTSSERWLRHYTATLA